jgi:hypothetical protein
LKKDAEFKTRQTRRSRVEIKDVLGAISTVFSQLIWNSALRPLRLDFQLEGGYTTENRANDPISIHVSSTSFNFCFGHQMPRVLVAERTKKTTTDKVQIELGHLYGSQHFIDDIITSSCLCFPIRTRFCLFLFVLVLVIWICKQ